MVNKGATIYVLPYMGTYVEGFSFFFFFFFLISNKDIYSRVKEKSKIGNIEKKEKREKGEGTNYTGEN